MVNNPTTIKPTGIPCCQLAILSAVLDAPVTQRTSRHPPNLDQSRHVVTRLARALLTLSRLFSTRPESALKAKLDLITPLMKHWDSFLL